MKTHEKSNGVSAPILSFPEAPAIPASPASRSSKRCLNKIVAAYITNLDRVGVITWKNKGLGCESI